MENVLELKNFRDLSNEEVTNIDGGIVITGSMVVAGIGLIGAGYAFGSWVKNKLF